MKYGIYQQHRYGVSIGVWIYTPDIASIGVVHIHPPLGVTSSGKVGREVEYVRKRRIEEGKKVGIDGG